MPSRFSWNDVAEGVELDRTTGDSFDLRAAITRASIRTAADEDGWRHLVATSSAGDPRNWTVTVEKADGTVEALRGDPERYFPGVDFARPLPWAWALPADTNSIQIATGDGQIETMGSREFCRPEA